MIKTIYHGSNKIIEKPLFGFGKTYNDYGLGFYCTEVLDMAKEWGVSKDNDGFANIYELETEGLTLLDLNSSEYTILHWLEVLLENRIFDITNSLAQEAKEYLLKNFTVPYKDYDIITGYRADDSYFSFAQDFINGAISVRQLGNAMKLGNPGTQFVLKSKKAFKAIQYKGYEVAESAQWFSKKELRDKTARRHPEYWCGWALAYFQWQTNLRFKEINNYISISEILAMYSPYHEMDISQFCDKMIELYNKRKNDTNLKAIRLDAGLSQSELAEISDIPVRTIQQYEQNQKNINAAKAETVVKLAKALNCTVEALMEAV